jgi:hypothetical protein
MIFFGIKNFSNRIEPIEVEQVDGKVITYPVCLIFVVVFDDLFLFCLI